MAERAARSAGRLDAGPRPGGGFRVAARLPVRRAGAGVIRVLLADDQALVRAGFRALLDSQDDLRWSARRGRRRGGAAGRRAGPGRGADGHPDAGRGRAVRDPADRRRPALDGVRVVVLTTFELDEYVFAAIRNGASGFLVKDTEPVDLLRAVRSVAAGDALLSPGVTRRLIEEFALRSREPAAAGQLAPLTEREREVLGLVGEG
jgi:DNA-binding NarL/FixJ family response regulator